MIREDYRQTRRPGITFPVYGLRRTGWKAHGNWFPRTVYLFCLTDSHIALIINTQ